MDSASVTVEPEVNIFEGLTFGDACEMLLAKCKSSAPEVAGFQNTLDYVRDIHEIMGIEFNLETYWNEGVISGSHQLWPNELTRQVQITIPAEITREHLEERIAFSTRLTEIQTGYRTRYERLSGGRNGRGQGDGIFDSRLLDSAVNRSLVFTGQETDDAEDDFL
jgi:hypothetical protein